MGKLLIVTGLILLVIGVILHFLPGVFSWFGRLPGDIRITTAQGLIFIPLTSMMVVSVALTLVVNALAWVVSFFDR